MPSLFLCRLTQSSSSICTSRPLGRRAPSGTVPPLQRNVPELPPASMCLHSICRTKFSYCFSVRMTPIGCPLHTRRPSRTVQVSLSVLTFTHPERSLPLKSSRNCGMSAEVQVPIDSSTVTMQISTFIRSFMVLSPSWFLVSDSDFDYMRNDCHIQPNLGDIISDAVRG